MIMDLDICSNEYENSISTMGKYLIQKNVFGIARLDLYKHNILVKCMCVKGIGVGELSMVVLSIASG